MARSENQWTEVISVLQEALSQLLIYGSYNPAKKQWNGHQDEVCMITEALPEAIVGCRCYSIIYLPDCGQK